eukprot:Nk52_evm6s1129 gene=Nk52_evmTU6s1129
MSQINNEYGCGVAANNEEEWDDWEGEDEPAVCLFCEEIETSVEKCLTHMKEKHSCDIVSEFEKLKLDTYDCIKLINYMRAEKDTLSLGNAFVIPSASVWDKEEYLKPVLESDSLLMFDYEEAYESIEKDFSSDKDSSHSNEVVADEASALRNQLKEAQMAAKMAEMQLSEVTERLCQLQTVFENMVGGEAEESGDESNSSESEDEDENKNLSDYFQSYSHFGIHEDMLKDKIRTDSYRDFMYKNKSFFENKVVLDVGCGTSILSMFAANCGASEVIGVDMSNIVSHARKIVKANSLDDKITIVRGKIEETDITQYIKRDLKKVDIIISEWMGYYLLFESMLDSVLYARDQWLNPEGGVVHPDVSTIYLSAANLEVRVNESIEFWNDVYGFDMTPVKDSVYKEAFVEIVGEDKIVSQPFCLKTIDANTVKIKELEFVEEFSLVVNCKGDNVDSEKCVVVNALVGYFDSFFETGCENPVYFSTGPDATSTHWKQTVLYLENPLHCQHGDLINGSIEFKRLSTNHRGLSFNLSYSLSSQPGNTYTQTFILE